MKVITVATHASRYMYALQASCERAGLDLVVLGWGAKWQGFVWRQQLVLDFLKSQIDQGHSQELVVCVDAYDVVVLAHHGRTIADQFRALTETAHARIVISSDFGTSGVADYVYKRIYGAPFQGHKLNAGMYMGKTAALWEWLSVLASIQEAHQDDQRRMLQWCHAHPEQVLARFGIVFDSQGWLFFNCTPHHDRSQWYWDDCNRLVLHRGGKSPCFVHGPGNSNLDDILERYGYPGLSRHNNGETSNVYFTWKSVSNVLHCFVMEIVWGSILIGVALALLLLRFRRHKRV